MADITALHPVSTRDLTVKQIIDIERTTGVGIDRWGRGGPTMWIIQLVVAAGNDVPATELDSMAPDDLARLYVPVTRPNSRGRSGVTSNTSPPSPS